MPVIRTLGNPGFRDRHWENVSNTVGFPVSGGSNLSQILDMGLDEYVAKFDKVKYISVKSVGLFIFFVTRLAKRVHERYTFLVVLFWWVTLGVNRAQAVRIEIHHGTQLTTLIFMLSTYITFYRSVMLLLKNTILKSQCF